MIFEAKVPYRIYTSPPELVWKAADGLSNGPVCPDGAVPSSREADKKKYLDLARGTYPTAALRSCAAEEYGFEAVELGLLSKNSTDCVLTANEVRVISQMCRLEVKSSDMNRPPPIPSLMPTKIAPPAPTPTSSSAPDTEKMPVTPESSRSSMTAGSTDTKSSTQNNSPWDILYGFCFTGFCLSPIAIGALLLRIWEIRADNEDSSLPSAAPVQLKNTQFEPASTMSGAGGNSNQQTPLPVTSAEARDLVDHIEGVIAGERDATRLDDIIIQGNVITATGSRFTSPTESARPLTTEEVQNSIALATGAKKVQIEQTTLNTDLGNKRSTRITIYK